MQLSTSKIILDHFQAHMDDFKFIQPTNQFQSKFMTSIPVSKIRDSDSWQFLNFCEKSNNSKSEMLGESVQPEPRKYRFKMMDSLKTKKNICGPKPTIVKKKLKSIPLIIKLPLAQKSADGLFNKPKRYSCISCPEHEFYCLTAFLRHVRKHHKEGLLVCELCEKDFTNPHALQRHLRLRCRKL